MVLAAVIIPMILTGQRFLLPLLYSGITQVSSGILLGLMRRYGFFYYRSFDGSTARRGAPINLLAASGNRAALIRILLTKHGGGGGLTDIPLRLFLTVWMAAECKLPPQVKNRMVSDE